MGSVPEIPAIFMKSEGTQRAFGALAELVGKLSKVALEEKKTCVHFVTGKGAFLGVHPRRAGVLITLPLNRPLPEDRVVKCEQTSSRRYYNDLLIPGDGFIDPELRDWIREAYELKS